MKRVVVKNGVISTAFSDPPYAIGQFPKPREERKGTIMVYVVDREKLKRENDETR